MATGVKGEQISLGLEISAGLSSNPNIEDISVPTCDPSDEDEIKVEINSALTEIHISESMDHFQKAIIENVDTYLNLSEEQQVTEFENIWKQTFGIEDQEEELRECQANFSDLYSLFGIECTTMEIEQTIYSMFSNLKFDMNSIIEYIKDELLSRFRYPSKLDQSERLIYPTYEYHSPIKEMMPYNGRPKYEYLCKDSLYKIERPLTGSFYNFKTLKLFKWIPNDCHGLIKYCSGFENHSDITRKPNYMIQVATLTSVLRNPDDMKTSTWEKFINDISSDVITILENPGVTHAIVNQIIHALYFRIRLLNYEIGYILAGLSNTAERTLSSLVFAYAFKYIWEKKLAKRRENQSKKELKKKHFFQHFLKTIKEHKIIGGSERLDRDKVSKGGVKISVYAINYIGLIETTLKSFVQSNVKTFCEKREDSLSHASLLSLANDLLLKELANKSVREVTDVNNFVVRFICNRNTVLQRLFHEKWDELELPLYSDKSEKIKRKFLNEMVNIKSVINLFISDLEKNAKGDFQCFNTDRNFELAEPNSHDSNDPTIKKIPFKAMTHYLKMYLDPNVPLGKFMKHIFGGFEIDGIKVMVSDSFVLCSKPIEPILELETFEKLKKTGMFNSTELIMNIYDYIKQFQTVLEDFSIEIGQNNFEEMVTPFKTELQKKIVGCLSQCPSCGKFCEREVHTNEGKCQIKTGHQISSMGGKVWNADKDITAVLFMCDDYKNYTRVTSPCGEMEWGEFKDKCGSEWNWTLPTDKMNTSKQLSNQNIMKDVWNKFGRGILNYYETQGTRISYVPYTDSEEVEMWRQRSGGKGSVSSQIFIDYKT